MSTEAADIVIIPGNESATDPATKAKTEEFETALADKYKKHGDQKPPVKQAGDAPPAKDHGNAELRKSRDEAIEKIKVHEASLKERDTKLTELQQQLSDFEGTRKERDELKTRIESVEKERDGLKKNESVSALEQSEPFQEKFVRGEAKHIDRLKELALLADIAPEDLLAAVNKTGRDHVDAMESILGSAGRYVSGDITATVKAIQELRREKTEQLASASEIMSKRISDQTAAERQKSTERSETRAKAWDATASTLGKELGLSPEKIAEAAEFFKSNKDAGKAAEVTIRAHALDAVTKERDEFKAELAKYQAADPTIRAGDLSRQPGKVDYKAERKKLVAEFDESTAR